MALFIEKHKLSKTLGIELKSASDVAVKIVNYIKMRPLKRRLFKKLSAGMEADTDTEHE